MPLYTVRYRNNQEFSFNSPSIMREEQIFERLLEYEEIIPRLLQDRLGGTSQGTGPSLKDIAEQNNLAPILYTEDESEPISIA